jgi:hypothetical protein
MQTIASLSIIIAEHVAKFAFVLDSGSIIKSTISDQSLMQLTRFIPRICQDLKVGTYLHQSHLYIYRVTTQFIIFLLTAKEPQEIITLMNEIGDRFTLKLARDFTTHPINTLSTIVKSIVFSVTTEKGPELMDWIVSDHSINDKDTYKIAMKTMLNLTDELEGAKKKILFFQPFLMYDSLGISYLFQIPFPGARGGSFDSALTILVDFKHRAVIYSLYKEIENILYSYEPKIANEFQRVYREDICLSRDDFNGILINLQQQFDKIKLNLLDSEVLIDEMVEAVRELNEL